MTPLVSEKHRYILFYNPKSACSVARQIFIELHREDLPDHHKATLQALRDAQQDDWHDINHMFPMQAGVDYSDYFKFTLVRHPLMRFVSAYLNRIVVRETDLDNMRAYFLASRGADYEPNFCFDEFVEYVCGSDKGSITNVHFLGQSHTVEPIRNYEIRTPLQPLLVRLGRAWSKMRYGLPANVVEFDFVCKMESLGNDFHTVYRKIFKSNKEMKRKAEQVLKTLPLYNVTFASNEILSGASQLSAAELRELGKMPSYESFLHPEACERLSEYYRDDFYNYAYSDNITKTVKQFEAQKKKLIEAFVPPEFDWQCYLGSNPDLSINGVDNKAKAISHWIHHGRFEDRVYKKEQ